MDRASARVRWRREGEEGGEGGDLYARFKYAERPVADGEYEVLQGGRALQRDARCRVRRARRLHHAAAALLLRTLFCVFVSRYCPERQKQRA